MRNLRPVAVPGVLTVGVALRFLAASRGHNFDVESYGIVGEIFTRGENVYRDTERYNYGPAWFLLAGTLYRLTVGSGLAFAWFRFAITATLTLVDIALFTVVRRDYGLRAGCLLFLNPIAIVITGFHSQFDNVAILLGLLAVRRWKMHEQRCSADCAALVSAVLLGLSLIVKHVLVALPFWLAVRVRGWWPRVAVLALPAVLFLASLAPFWPGAGDAIVEHIFLYRSTRNAPLLSTFWPGAVPAPLATGVFIVVLIVAGWWSRRLPMDLAFFVYLGLLVAAAPGLANHYLAIPLVGLSVLRHPIGMAFMVLASVHLFADPEGLHLSNAAEANLAEFRGVSFSVLTIVLAVALVGVVRRCTGPPDVSVKSAVANRLR